MYQRINQKSDSAQQEAASDKQRHFARIQREMKLQNAMQMQCKAYVTCVSCEIPHTHTHSHTIRCSCCSLLHSRGFLDKNIFLFRRYAPNYSYLFSWKSGTERRKRAHLFVSVQLVHFYRDCAENKRRSSAMN